MTTLRLSIFLYVALCLSLSLSLSLCCCSSLSVCLSGLTLTLPLFLTHSPSLSLSLFESLSLFLCLSLSLSLSFPLSLSLCLSLTALQCKDGQRQSHRQRHVYVNVDISICMHIYIYFFFNIVTYICMHTAISLETRAWGVCTCVQRQELNKKEHRRGWMHGERGIYVHMSIYRYTYVSIYIYRHRDQGTGKQSGAHGWRGAKKLITGSLTDKPLGCWGGGGLGCSWVDGITRNHREWVLEGGWGWGGGGWAVEPESDRQQTDWRGVQRSNFLTPISLPESLQFSLRSLPNRTTQSLTPDQVKA